MRVGDLVFDVDLSVSGIIIAGRTFDNKAYIPHEWEFLIMLPDGSIEGTDRHSMEVLSENR